MKVTDVKKGHFVFTPRPDRPVVWKEMREGIVKAGYDIEATSIEVHGALIAEGRLQATGTGQTFALSGPNLAKLRREVPSGSALILSGRWSPGSQGSQGAQGESIEVERWQVEK
jgi:hypothetical protein